MILGALLNAGRQRGKGRVTVIKDFIVLTYKQRVLVKVQLEGE